MVIKGRIRKIKIETLIMYALLILMAITVIAYIFVSQDDLTTSRWWIIVRYSQLGVTILSMCVCLTHVIQSGTMHNTALKVLCCLLYVTFVGFMSYFPGLLNLFSDVYAWPMVFVAFYIYSIDNDVNQFSTLVAVLHFLVCLSLIKTFQLKSLGMFANTGSIYHAISFIPLTLFLCNKKSRIILTAFTIILVVLSAKRTGIIALFVGYISYLLIRISIQMTTKEKRRQIFYGVLTGVVIFILAMIYSEYVEKIMERFRGISVDQGSGRQEIWKLVYNEYRQSSLLQRIFGHGIQAVPAKVRPFNKTIFSHNSYIEYLYDLGIVGVGSLIMIVLKMICSVIHLIKEKNEFAPTAGFCVCIILTFSLFSYCFEESNYILMLAAYWGMMQGYKKRA